MKRAISMALILGCAGLAACNGNVPPPTAASLDSGITSSNGGGQRATGGLPDVSVTNGQANVGTLPRNPTTPRF